MCRDATFKFTESLGLEFIPLSNNAINLDRDVTYIIECGWKTEEYVNNVEILVNRLISYNSNFYFRIVDDPEDKYTNLDCRIYYLIKKYNVRIITPYRHKYFGEFEPYKVIPYHFEEAITGSHDKDVILSGFDNPIYPLRHQLYESASNFPNWITILKHPGYSGRCWKDGKLGKDFVKELSNYKIMIVTTAQDFELLKYVECAEAGCCPIGEFPTSILDIIPEKLLWLNSKTVEEIIYKCKCLLNQDNWKLYSKDYREFMMSYRNKNSMLKSYYEL